MSTYALLDSPGTAEYHTNMESEQNAAPGADPIGNPFEGLSREELHFQLTQYILTEKQLKNSISQCIRDYELWKGRIQTALSQNREDLAEKAKEELSTFAAKLSSLDTELSSLEGEIGRVREQIRNADIKQRTHSGVDAQALLQNIESMTGKSADEIALERSFKDGEADGLLAELKARMAAEKDSGSAE